MTLAQLEVLPLCCVTRLAEQINFTLDFPLLVNHDASHMISAHQQPKENPIVGTTLASYTRRNYSEPCFDPKRFVFYPRMKAVVSMVIGPTTSALVEPATKKARKNFIPPLNTGSDFDTDL